MASASNTDCNDARVYTGFTGSALTSTVQSAATQGWTNTTFGLRAADETNHNGWKKFDAGTATLAVTYNSYPNAPDTLTIDGMPCGTATSPSYLSTLGGHNPVLKARLSDPDAADHLTGTFTWTTASGTASASQANIANGQYAQVPTTGAAFTSGTTYSFSVSASDGTDTSKASGGPCYFVVDNTAPSAAPTVASADGRYKLPDCDVSHAWCDGVGKTGTFTLGANGVSDVASYLYGLGTNPPTTSVAANALGGTATIAVTPMNKGVNDLYVRSVDRVGNLGPVTDYRFYVNVGTPAVGIWALDESNGTTAVDTGSGGHNATLSGAVSFGDAGRVIDGTAAKFTGATAAISTAAQVFRTDQSYSVSAWVKLADKNANHDVISQSNPGGSYNPFYLYYEKSSDRWVMTAPSAGTGSPSWHWAISSTSPQVNTWTHLAAVYDAAAGQFRLYVNGVLDNTANGVIAWNVASGSVIGQGHNEGFFSGDIADVRVWDRAAAPDEIAKLAAPTLVGSWDLDEGSGTTASDNTGRNTLTLSGGAAFTSTGHNFNDLGAASFDGSSGMANATGPVIRTDQSYSVAAWVNPTALGANRTVMTVTNPGGYGAFYLEYNQGLGRWCITAPDTSSPAQNWRYAQSTAAPTLNTWVHLAAVYDAAAHQFSLYVNGVLQGTAGSVVAWPATGQLSIGSSNNPSLPTEYFAGQIDAVRVYQGVLSASDIQTLANS